MTELSATAIAASGLRAQGVRLRHISENIANADTPGYRRKLVAFEPGRDFGRDTGAVRAGRATATLPGPAASRAGSPSCAIASPNSSALTTSTGTVRRSAPSAAAASSPPGPGGSTATSTRRSRKALIS